MTSPEKIGIVLVIAVVAVAGYFLYDLLMSPGSEDISEFQTPEYEKKEEESARVEDHILDGGEGGSFTGEEALIREEIVPQRETIIGTQYGNVLGRVVDESGNPIEGASVTLHKGGSSILTHLPAQEKVDIDDTTDKKGHYQLVGIESGESYSIQAKHPDFADVTFSPLRVKAGVRLEIPDLVMGHGIVVKGVVGDELGNPILGATVQIQDPVRTAFLQEKKREPWKQILTDGSGSYRFENVSFKTFEITASAKGYATQRKSSNVQFEAKSESVIDFKLSPGMSISGTAMDDKGQPLSEAKIEATQVHNKDYSSSGTMITQEDGLFTIKGLARGTYVVRGSKKGYSDDVKQGIKHGNTNLELVLEPRGGVSGTVRDGETNQPLKKFQVRAVLIREGRAKIPTKVVESFDTEDGSYTITDLEPGLYAFLVTAKNYADCASEDITVARDYIIENVDVYMNKGGEISGELEDRSGKPLAGVKVTLNDNNFEDNPLYQIFQAMAGPKGKQKKRSVLTEKDGSFTMNLIAPGIYQVAFSHGDYSNKSINDVEVYQDRETAVGRVVLTEGARVHGTVYDATGAVVPGATVSIARTKNSAFMKQTTTDKKGKFSFNHLLPGEYSVSILVNRLKGKEIGNILDKLFIAEKSKVVVYLEEGKDQKADIRLVQ